MFLFVIIPIIQRNLTKLVLTPKPIIIDPKYYTFLKTRDRGLQLSPKQPIDPVKYLVAAMVSKYPYVFHLLLLQ